MAGFDFYAGHVALDFTNTVAWRNGEARHELLVSYGELLRWSRQAGVLEPARVVALSKRAAPRAAETALERALEFRETSYRLFEARMNGVRPRRRDLARMNAFIEDFARDAHIRWSANVFEWGVRRNDLEAMLEPLVRATAELLTSADAAKVAQCRDDRGCGWLFLDKSRAKARRWCSMSDCGNRAKAKRHYRRAAKTRG